MSPFTCPFCGTSNGEGNTPAKDLTTCSHCGESPSHWVHEPPPGRWTTEPNAWTREPYDLTEHDRESPE